MNNLKTVRKSDPRKLTQKDVADFLGADRSTYAKYETGDSEPNFDTLSRLSDFFGVSIEYLMGRSNTKKAPSYEDAGLSAEEAELLKLFRSAPEALQDAALRVLEANQRKE